MITAIENFLNSYGISVGWFSFIVGTVIALFAFNSLDVEFGRTIAFAIAISPIWLPVVLFFVFFDRWKNYVQQKWNLQQNGRVTIEIKIPEEIFKSPEAMELVLTQMFQKASPDNIFQTYLDGKNPPTFGLEMVSNGGNVHFYINMPRKKNKNIIETQLYAQYPGIEVRELPVDYTAEVVWGENWDIFGIHFGLSGPDVYPIKTYYDFGLADNPKEEEKHDPITPILELLSSAEPNERIWYQILINVHRKEDFKVGSLRTRPDWKGDIDKEVNTILENCKKRSGVGDDDSGGFTQLTDADKQKISALQRSRSKYAYNTVIRAIYAAKDGAFNPGERIGAMITAILQFQDANTNGIGMRWRTDFDYNMWQDPSGKKRTAMKKKVLDHYKRRVHDPFKDTDKPSIMTTEEIATLFHLPGKVVLNPNVERLPSKRSEAPSNLPV